MIGLMVAEGRADAVVIKPTWCLPPTTNNTTTSTTLPSSSSPGSSSSSRASSSSSSSSSQQAHLAHHHKKHEWNQHRLEEDLSSSPLWGGDERGALRDWNEEVGFLNVRELRTLSFLFSCCRYRCCCCCCCLLCCRFCHLIFYFCMHSHARALTLVSELKRE